MIDSRIDLNIYSFKKIVLLKHFNIRDSIKDINLMPLYGFYGIEMSLSGNRCQFPNWLYEQDERSRSYASIYISLFTVDSPSVKVLL